MPLDPPRFGVLSHAPSVEQSCVLASPLHIFWIRPCVMLWGVLIVELVLQVRTQSNSVSNAVEVPDHQPFNSVST